MNAFQNLLLLLVRRHAAHLHDADLRLSLPDRPDLQICRVFLNHLLIAQYSAHGGQPVADPGLFVREQPTLHGVVWEPVLFGMRRAGQYVAETGSGVDARITTAALSFAGNGTVPLLVAGHVDLVPAVDAWLERLQADAWLLHARCTHMLCGACAPPARKLPAAAPLHDVKEEAYTVI